MGLKIGDVSKLLNMSVETIRFYEGEKIVTPSRDEESKYRDYQSWDIFFLFECLKFRKFELSVKEISEILHIKSIEFLSEKLSEKQTDIINEIQYKTLLCEKLNQYQKLVETIHLNLGNFWFKKIPEHLYFTYLGGEGDKYEDFRNVNPLFTQWLEYLPFIDIGVHFTLENILSHKKTNPSLWSHMIEKKYADALNITTDETVKSMPEQLCLCTVINAGNKGDLTLDLLDPIIDHVRSKELEICGDLSGKLLARSHEGKQLYRYIEMQVPVKTLK